LVLTLAVVAAATAAPALTPIEELGKLIYFDNSLSVPPGQACAACHAPEVGFTGPDSKINLETAVYPGANEHRFGNRKPPSAAYGGGSPVMYYDETEGLFIGGMFWDGRATGWTLGDPLAEQAQGPFLNPLEQNMPHAWNVVLKVAHSDYAGLFEEVWGPGSLDLEVDPDGDGAVDMDLDMAAVALAYERIARSISAFEKSDEVNPFTSKYDYYLAGAATLTEQEAWGLELFEGKGMCNLCHISEPGPSGEAPLFTDFTYDNLGIPKNPGNPFYHAHKRFNPAGADWIDPGLGGFLANVPEFAAYAAENMGKHKVPTLRNVDKRPYPEFVKAYGHNGFFKSLLEIVHFYNTRDVEPWPLPEVPENVNVDELGDLMLTPEEEAAIVAFMGTLSDGYVPTFAAKTAGLGSVKLGLAGGTAAAGLKLSYYLPRSGAGALELFNIRGQRVAVIDAGRLAAGEHVVTLPTQSLASGLYVARLAQGGSVATQKVMVVK
jgi:cytochrome c peroxidase